MALASAVIEQVMSDLSKDELMRLADLLRRSAITDPAILAFGPIREHLARFILLLAATVETYETMGLRESYVKAKTQALITLGETSR